MKEKIAISLDHDLLKRIDSKIDGIRFRSRSQAIEYFTRGGLFDENISIAVIMMKGDQQTISLKSFKGKSLIEHQIDFFLSHGIKKIYYLTQRASFELQSHLKKLPIDILETKSGGNADALAELKKIIHNSFVAISGDTYNNFDLDRMIDRHKSVGKIAIMGLMTRERSAEYGTAILDGDLIIDFKEKWEGMASHIVNAGIYVFTPEIFSIIKGGSLEKDVFPQLANLKQLGGFFTYGEYEHLG